MKNFTKFFMFLSILVGFGSSTGSFHLPEINTPFGKVQGYYKTAQNGQIFSAYEGVPYALPPNGKYRFEEPRPLVPWKGIWIANHTTRCIQYDHLPIDESRKIDGEEDCLYLYIYTPKHVDQNTPLDVIIHIHGGAFMFGDGHSWGPDYLLERNVIYVNFNYRLGPFGFLSTEDDVVPGNNGLKDQSMALKWIHENIQYFGGNPESITLTGLSAGGASVTYHYMSPMSAGLFNRGFAISGSALNPWAFAENSLVKTKLLAASVGCDHNTIPQMIKCLKKRPAYQIAKAVKLFLPYMYNPFSPFAPVVEKGGNNPFITEEPREILKQGKVQDLPLIISLVKHEGLYPAAEFKSNPNILPEINERWEELAPFILDYYYSVPKDQHASLARDIKAKYLYNQNISDETYSNFVQIVSDRLFSASLEETAKLFSKAMKSRVYQIYFTYRGEFSFSQLLTKDNTDCGVSHADDMLYVLKYHGMEINFKDFNQMKNLIVDLWIDYAKNGTVKVGNVEPKPYVVNENGEYNYLEIKSPTKQTEKTINTLSNSDFWIDIK